MSERAVDVGVVADKLDLNRGGSNHSLHLTARELARRGHEVTVYCLHLGVDSNVPPADPPYSVVDNEIRYVTLFDGFARLVRFFRAHEQEHDVFHVWKPLFAPAAGVYRRLGGSTPVVTRLNEYGFCSNQDCMGNSCWERCGTAQKFEHSPRSLSTRLSRLPKYTFDTHLFGRFASCCDRLFAQSPAVKEVYAGVGVDPDRIEVIGNFTDRSFDPGDDSDESPTFTVLYVGRIEKKKGLGTLLGGLSRLDVDWQLDVVGDDETAYADSVMRQAETLGITGRVAFHGRVPYDEVSQFYRRADAFVHPGSWPDPFPRTVLEAMQSGTPVVVTETGGPPWIVGDAGLTVEPNEPWAIANALATLHGSPELRRELAARGIERVSTFGPSTVVPRLLRAYRDVLGGGVCGGTSASEEATLSPASETVNR